MAAKPDQIKETTPKPEPTDEGGMTAAQRAEHDAKTGYERGGVSPARPDGSLQYRETKGTEFAAEKMAPTAATGPTVADLMRDPDLAGSLTPPKGAETQIPPAQGEVSAESIRFLALGDVLSERI